MEYTVRGILQARIPEWVAFPFSKGSGLPHYKWILYQLSHKGSPRILEWITYPFSSRSSRPRNRTRVSCIAGRFFTSWNPRILEWVASPFSSRSSWPRNQKWVSCIQDQFLTNWAIREALVYSLLPGKERINTFGKTLNYFKNNRKDLSILFLENGLLLRKTALICYWFFLIGLQGNSNYFSTFPSL